MPSRSRTKVRRSEPSASSRIQNWRSRWDHPTRSITETPVDPPSVPLASQSRASPELALERSLLSSVTSVTAGTPDSPIVGPPRYEIPGSVQTPTLAFGTGLPAIGLLNFRVHSTGLAFTSLMWVPPMDSEVEREVVMSLLRTGTEGIAGGLVLGVKIADQEVARNTDTHSRHGDGEGSPPYDLIGLGGSTQGDHWRFEWWLRPLPDVTSQIALQVTWSRFGLETEEVELPVRSISRALTEVRTVLPQP